MSKDCFQQFLGDNKTDSFEVKYILTYKLFRRHVSFETFGHIKISHEYIYFLKGYIHIYENNGTVITVILGSVIVLCV